VDVRRGLPNRRPDVRARAPPRHRHASLIDGLAPAERPKKRNKRAVAVLDANATAKLVAEAASERWRAAVGLAGYAGLRLGIRALTWSDVDLGAGTLTLRRSVPDGTAQAPKTEAGARSVPILPALRRLLVSWKLRTPRNDRRTS
jgi:integrase